jgi:hypothetical protein
VQYLSIHYTEHLAELGASASVIGAGMYRSMFDAAGC